MISILFASRVKDNPDSNLPALFASTLQTCTDEELKQIEFLIKFDDDDELRPKEFRYPFPVKTVCYSRGTGRSNLHHFCEYLFTLHDPKSRFVLVIADDFVFTRPGWVSEILEHKERYLFIGSGQCDREPGPYHSKPRPPIETIDRYNMESWRCCFGNAAQCFSVPLIEVCQNFGWSSSIDAWGHLLAISCYQDFDLQIFRYMEAFYRRTEGKGVFPNQQRDQVFRTGADASYNKCQLTGSRNVENLYWFDLVKQQAKNILLNHLQDNLLDVFESMDQK